MTRVELEDGLQRVEDEEIRKQLSLKRQKRVFRVPNQAARRRQIAKGLARLYQVSKTNLLIS